MRISTPALGSVLVLGALVLLHPSRSSACSCVEPRLSRRVVPSDGAVDFPTGGAIRVFLEAFPPSVRAALASEYRIVDASGAAVSFDAHVEQTRLDLTPRAPLSASSTYTLEQVFVFDAQGTRLDDSQRLASHAPLRGAWFPVATFRTASAAVPARSVTPVVSESHLHFAMGGGDCGPGAAVGVSLGATTSTALTDVVELRVRGQGTVATAPLAALEWIGAGDLLCDPDPIRLAPGATLHVQLVAIDATGAEIGASPWVTVRGSGTRPRSRSLRSATTAWPAPTIVPTPPPAPASGPSTCPFGLEVATRRDVVSEGAHWAYGDRSMLATDARGRGWIVFSGPESAHETMQLFQLAPDGGTSAVASAVSGYPRAIAIGASGPLVVEQTWTDALSHGQVVQLDAHGASAWSYALPDGCGDIRIARGGGRVLAAWSARQADYSTLLGLALLDEATGAQTFAALPTTEGVDANSEGPAAAFVDGRFLVVWGGGHGLIGRGPLRAGIVTSAGFVQVRDLAISTYAPPDLVAAGDRAGLATGTSDGRIEWSLLDRDGAVTVGPVLMSSGIGGGRNRLPRIAYDGHTFAVAWETHPEPGVYVAVVDDAGHVSPALRIDALEADAGTVGIAPTPSGWLASYTVGRSRGRLATLRCRTSAALGAPQSIGPAAP